MDCLICFKHHPLNSCPIFNTYTVKQRAYTVRVHRYCSNCFSRTHTAMGCSSLKRCLKCGEPHHTMLHPNKSEALKNGSILPVQQCLVKDPLTIPRKIQTPLERVGQHALQPRKRQCLDELTSVSKCNGEESEANDDTELVTRGRLNLEEEVLDSDDGSELDENVCIKNKDEEFEDDSYTDKDKGGRPTPKGCCYICHRNRKWKRKTRTTCIKCTKPICVQHSFTQTKCKDCHMGIFNVEPLFASNSKDTEFQADDVEDRDASGRLRQKGRCNLCQRDTKRGRATRKVCVTCKNPVCAQHYKTQTKCEDCYTGPSKTLENS